MYISELLDKGGVVMFVILMLSVYVFAVIIYKIYQFKSLETSKTAFIDDIMICIENKKDPEAIKITQLQKNPIAHVIEIAIKSLSNKRMNDDRRKEMISASGTKTIAQLEKHLRGLELAANIAPLLGLLGTVIGMVKAFSSIEQVGSRIDPSMLAGGIWEALLTTVAGLIVAIPALAAYYIIDGKIENFRNIMGNTVSNIIAKYDS